MFYPRIRSSSASFEFPCKNLQHCSISVVHDVSLGVIFIIIIIIIIIIVVVVVLVVVIEFYYRGKH